MRGAVGSALGAGPAQSRPFNLAVIPPDTPDGPIDVYALMPQTQNPRLSRSAAQFRATRFTPPGEIAVAAAFTNSCLNLPLPPRTIGRRPVITHLLDPMPTEIHVFLSIWMGLPRLSSPTDEPLRIWRSSSGDRITLVMPRPLC